MSKRTGLDNGNLCKVLQLSSEQTTKHPLHEGVHEEFGMGGKSEPMAVTCDEFQYKTSFGDYLKHILICATELVMVYIALPIVLGLKGSEMWMEYVVMFIVFVGVIGGTLCKIYRLAVGNGSKWMWSSIDSGLVVLTFILVPEVLVINYPVAHQG